MVPGSIQQAVWASYREGQCDDLKPSHEWHRAADAAIGYVAFKEFKPLTKGQVAALDFYGWVIDGTTLTRSKS